MPATMLEKPSEPLPPRSSVFNFQPVSVEVDSIRLRPERMEIGKFYLAQFRDEPYLYRRVSEGEIEVYGLAE